MLKSTQIGPATARLFEAKAMVELYAQMLRADPYRLFGMPQGAGA